METQSHLNLSMDPFCFTSLLELRIEKRLNEHTKFFARGVVSEEEQDEIAERASVSQTVALTAEDGGKTLFCGILSGVELCVNMDVREASLYALSFTAQMDLQRNVRTFQDEKMTYEKLLEEVTKPYGGDVMDNATGGKSIGSIKPEKPNASSCEASGVPIIQYDETDWEFAKRLASHFNAALCPADGYDKLRYYAGAPGISGGELESANYEVKKDLALAARLMKNGVKLTEQDALAYAVKSPVALELGAKVKFKGREYFIAAIETVLQDSLLMHTYELRSKAALQVEREYNERLCGLSLFGNVKEIEKDKVKIALDVDSNNSACGEKWFGYSTVYSSPDGSGWYAMPEKDDRVRLACPDKDERNAFCASAVDLEASSSDFRSKPEYKVMHTVNGKYLEFRPDQVEILTNEDTAITLKDDGGVFIRSGKDVTITAEKDVLISSEKGNVSLEGKQVHLISKQGGAIKLTKNVVASGSDVNVQ